MKKVVRNVLAVSLSAVMVASLASCASDPGESPSATSNSGTKKATLNIVDYSDSTKSARLKLNKKFEADNPGVTINYTCLTQDQYASTVVTAINAGNSPDLFILPVGTTLSSALSQNWFQPINDYVSKDFFSKFSDGVLNEGITSVGDKIYSIPENVPKCETLFYYNKTILSENKIDPASLTTWTAFENACKTITANGKGKYYGIVEGFTQTNRLELMARTFASLGGAKCNVRDVISFQDDGSSWFNSTPMLESMGYIQKLGNDKVFHPNSSSISAPEARALFGQGQAAFIMQGSWCIPVWRKNNPDLDFGVIATPSPDSGRKGKIAVSIPSAWMGISATTKVADVAGKYLEALYGETYQGECVAAGGFISTLKGVNEKYNKDQAMIDYLDVASKISVTAPNAVVANVNSAEVYSQAKSVSPSLGQVTQGVLTGSIKDYKSTLDTLANATQTEWKRAISSVSSKGKQVSISDFEFPNWTGSKDYTEADYKAKKSK